jgi:hypothetical protein
MRSGIPRHILRSVLTLHQNSRRAIILVNNVHPTSALLDLMFGPNDELKAANLKQEKV